MKTYTVELFVKVKKIIIIDADSEENAYKLARESIYIQPVLSKEIISTIENGMIHEKRD